MKPKLIRISTVPISLNILLKGQLAFLNHTFQVIVISGEGEDLDEVRERERVQVIPLEMQREISPIKDIISLVKLYFLLKKEKPQIIHSITPKAGLLSMLAAKLAGVPIRLHTFTGLIFPSKKGWLQKLLIQMDRLLCWAATRVYPEGEGVRNDLIKYKITKKNLKIIANGNVNGIDTTYFSPEKVDKAQSLQLKKQLGIQETDFVYIFVGRLVGDKGVNELIQAFKKIENKNIKLLLVGAQEHYLDPLPPDIIYEIETSKNILAVGFQKDVRPYFAISDALVFPSYREGFPNVVMQAGAMGLPSIVSDINGCNEIIINNENGWIVPPKNTEQLYLAMKKILEDRTAYLSLKEKSRALIVDRYQQHTVWNALEKEYNELLNELAGI